jgi:enterochelin esterase-like enzyme
MLRAAWRSATLLLLAFLAGPAPARALEFHLTFDRTVSDKPFTGRVYLMLFKDLRTQLAAGPSWFRPEPFFARDVKGWKPGATLVFKDGLVGYPVPSLAKLPRGTYSVQAVMDFDRGHINFSSAPGNAHSRTVRRELDPTSTAAVSLKLDQVVKEKKFVETDRVKLVEVESKLLTAFYRRPARLRAGVVLPESYASNPAKRYPVVYEIPGFGGDHFDAFNAARRGATNVGGVEMLHVVLDPNCRTGHHVFADSANNGPCGRALVEELIPAIERRFRAVAKPQGRFVTGHSSGGWSSLWLQVSYPDFFNGVWATAPDPVDFRDFQKIDLYRPGVNMFRDETGRPRPIARGKKGPVLFYKGFSDMEEVMGHGGQLASFEAVFSPRAGDGRPRKLWDRKTGAVDAETAKGWEKYDIRLVLERNWKALGPKLAGKLHVYMGGADTFYLEGATELLGRSLKQLGSDAAVEIFPGRDHGTLMGADLKLRQRIAREMAARCRAARLES